MVRTRAGGADKSTIVQDCGLKQPPFWLSYSDELILLHENSQKNKGLQIHLLIIFSLKTITVNIKSIHGEIELSCFLCTITSKRL